MRTPASIPSVVGVTRTLGVPSPQTLGGQSYVFSGWSDGGGATHTIDTPDASASYVASFRVDCAEGALRPIAAVSSSDEAPALHAALAIDGDPSTRWSSGFSDPQWLYVDLGARRELTRVVLSWERAHARDYLIQVSDDPAGGFRTVFTRTSFGGGTDAIAGLTGVARYLRVYAGARATEWGNSLWELALFGPPSGGCPAAAPRRH